MRKLSFLSSVLSVSALLFALGSCTEGNIDNGDNTGGDQTPGEPVVYKVGDPYVVNGNTVGIVYEVDETGTHGKAYSLTVYNLSDKHFCIKEGEEKYMVPGNEYTKYYEVSIEEDAMPQSTADGAANCQKMKNETDWQTHMPALKWVEDLAASQGVAWYIPAIDELKELFEYMSGAEFTQVTWTSGSGTEFTMEAIPLENETAVKAAWAEVRNTYAEYAEGQYVVFETYVADESGSVTSEGDHQDLAQDPWTEIGDNYAYRWLSSTVGEGKMGTTSLYYISMYDETTTYPFPVVDTNMDSSMASQESNYMNQAGSIHPICKF